MTTFSAAKWAHHQNLLPSARIKVWSLFTASRMDEKCTNSSILIHDRKTFQQLLVIGLMRTRLSLDIAMEKLRYYSKIWMKNSFSFQVWNVSNQQCLKTIEEDRTVYQTMVTPTKDALITAGKDSDINVYDLDSLQKINTCKGEKKSLFNRLTVTSFAIFGKNGRPSNRSLCSEASSKWNMELYLRWMGWYCPILGQKTRTRYEAHLWSSYLWREYRHWSKRAYNLG